jgi:thiol-disulfide isomerase/thioredoxin
MIDVVVLSQSDCHFCDLAEQVLQRVARDYPLAVRHIALASQEGQALAARHGVMFAPGILLAGRLFSYGRPSERRLRRHLDRQFRGQASRAETPRHAADGSEPPSMPETGR